MASTTAGTTSNTTTISTALDLTITSLEETDLYSYPTGEYRCTLDELQDAKIANTEDKEDVTGANGVKLSSIKKNKAAVLSGTNAFISGGLLEFQTGSRIGLSAAATVKWTDYLTVSSNTATLSYAAVGTEGAEIDVVWVKDTSNLIIRKLTQTASTPTATTFTYDTSTKALTFKDGVITDGTEIVVKYTRKTGGWVLENKFGQYSEKVIAYTNAFAEDSCGNIYRVQFYFPKADFSGSFDIDMGGNQVTHGFEIEALAGACGSKGNLWTYTVFGAESA